jgi:hypothetical protein
MDAGGIDDLSRTVVANQIFGARELRVILARQLYKQDLLDIECQRDQISPR